MKKYLLLLLFLAACSSAQQQAQNAGQVNHCQTAGERATCLDDPKNCPCDAYGDCGMGNCLTHGEMVEAARMRAPVAVVAAPVTPAPVRHEEEAGPRRCRSDSDLRQCGEESYHCPCDAYGDCGQEYCLEPPVKPRAVERSCSSNQDRSDCRRDPSGCPCSVHGLCEMAECTLEGEGAQPPSAPLPPPPPPPPARVTQKHPCATAGEKSLCLADPWGCPCGAYGDCGMGSCR